MTTETTATTQTLYDAVNELRREAYDAARAEAENSHTWGPLPYLDAQDWCGDTLGNPDADWCVDIDDADTVRVYAAGDIEAERVIVGASALRPRWSTQA